MNYLYFIGGSTRSGKTTILNKVIGARPMIAIQTDAIREGVRKALIGKSLITVSKLSFSGTVTYQRLDDDKDVDISEDFSQELSQDELTWNAVAGLVNYYDNKGVSLIIEGMEITPERISSLALKNLTIRAAFVGITAETNLNTLLMKDNAKQNYEVIEERFSNEIEKSKITANAANKYGYKFYAFQNGDFEKYCKTVASYLLE